MGVVRAFRSGPECRECLKRLVDRTVDLSTNEVPVGEELKVRGKARIDELFREGVTLPANLANELLRMIGEATGCRDPYLQRKKKEMEESRKAAELLQGETRDFPRLLQLSALANSLDYFNPVDDLLEDCRRPFHWAIDDGVRFEELVKEGRGPFLYLVDNAGELYFDLPLFQAVARHMPESYYVVKGGPAQNDLTMKDFADAGLTLEYGSVITHGQAAVGLDVEELNADFRRLYDSAALLVVKGMGHFESLSAREQSGRALFVLKAKCSATAQSLGVENGAFVALMQ